MYTKPTAPVTIGKVLDGAFSLWWPSVKLTWPLVLVPKVVALILVYYKLGSSDLVTTQPLQLFAQSPVISVLQILLSLAGLGLYCAAFLRVDEFAHGRSLALGASIARGYERWVSAFVLTLLGFLAALPLGIAYAVILAAIPNGGAGAGAASLGAAGGSSIFAFFYLIFLLVIIGRLFLAFPILSVERISGPASIRSSWNLTRGYWWRCAAILTILAIVAYAIAFIFGLVVGVMGAREALQHGGAVPTLGRSAFMASMLLGLVSGLVFTPLFYGGLLSIYYDLKMRKEGGDLAGRVEALGSGRA